MNLSLDFLVSLTDKEGRHGRTPFPIPLYKTHPHTDPAPAIRALL